MSQTTAWARNPENPIPPRQGIVLTYMDQNTLGDVLVSAAETYGEDVMLSFLESAEEAYASGNDVGLPGLDAVDKYQAASVVASILDDYQQDSRLDGPTASSTPVVAASAPFATVLGGPINNNRSWLMTNYAYRSKCDYWLGVIPNCTVTDRVRIRITDDPGVSAGRIAVSTFYEMGANKISKITVLSWVYSSSGPLLSNEVIFNGYPVGSATGFARHGSQKGRSFYFHHRIISKFDAGTATGDYRTTNASCNSASTPTCKW